MRGLLRSGYLALGVLSISAVALGLGTLGQRSATEEADALTRIKQCNIGAMLYCSDYDDVYPYAQSTETAKAVLYPYVRNKNIFISPTKGAKFVYNLNVGGVVVEEIPNLKTTPVWSETAPSSIDPAVGYADGSAKIVRKAGRAALAAALKQKLPRRKNSKPLPKNYRPL